MIRSLVKLIRPKQWVKNTLVFAALIFAGRFLDPGAWWIGLLAFITFSLTASSIYVINDILDVEQDRLHPVKKHRPIASGAISLQMAILTAFLLMAITLIITFLYLPSATAWLLIGYAVVMIAYSLGIKHILLVDVLIIAGGLVLRAIYGAVALQVEISEWLLICAFLVSLLLALIKRRQELVRTGEKTDNVRRSLKKAPPIPVWDQWIHTIAGITILAYILYTVDGETIAHVGSNHLLLTTPFVIYAIFRYTAHMQVDNEGEDPTEALLKDRGMFITVLAWLVLVLLVLSKKL